MRTTTLGRSGLKVSAVGFGGIPIQRRSMNEAVHVVRRALDLGVTFIDTASGYTDSQQKIGRAIRGRRDGLVLATKTHGTTSEEALQHVQRSREELGVDCIDLYQLHGVSDAAKRDAVCGPGGALDGLREARDRGWIGHIGFTSHSREIALGMVENPVFETVQFPFNLVTAEPKDDLIPRALELGLGFIVMKPLCGGQYDNARLAFKFLNGYPDVVPIPGIERVEEIEEIVALVEGGEKLEGAEKEEAEQIAAELGKLFCRRCGYCMPCPHGVPITRLMIADGLVKRVAIERAVDASRRLVADVEKCIECGACVKKCPYDLPIPEIIRRNAEVCAEFLAQHA